MPWARFLRTPTVREQGDRSFVAGGVYELSHASFAHWTGLGAVELAEEPLLRSEEEGSRRRRGRAAAADPEPQQVAGAEPEAGAAAEPGAEATADTETKKSEPDAPLLDA